MKPAGHQIARALVAHGARRVFCVAGESYLPVLDGLLDYPEIEVVTCRQEGGVTFMAEAYGQMTGQPGIAMVTRGPGACNAAIGVHTAMQSSTPMILFVGLIATPDRDREAFQEFDLKQMFGSLSKWQAVIDSAERLSEYVARAWHIALSGRPGPVVLGLPEDVLFPAAPDQDIRIIPTADIAPRPSDIQAVKDALSAASAPLIVLGGGVGWSDQAISDIAAFSSAAHIPMVNTFRCQDIADNTHSNYIGELGTSSNPQLIECVKKADIILAVNARLDEMTLQSYTLFQAEQKIIHVYPSAEEFGKAVMPHIAVQAHAAPFCAAMAAAGRIDGRKWAHWRDEARADYLAWTSLPAPDKQSKSWNGADMNEIYRYLQSALPRDAIVTTDAGNFSGWAQRYIRYGRPGRLLAPVSGAMGYAVPAAVSAALEHPERTVLGICGDGGFMMNAQELATAAHYGAKPIIMICNNGIYGTIRMHQQREYPGRFSATSLTNPDFVMMAQSYGRYAARIKHADEFADIFAQAQSSESGAVIEIIMDPAQLTTRS
jgi:acetolactate synthase-1/2/3 large subunit